MNVAVTTPKDVEDLITGNFLEDVLNKFEAKFQKELKTSTSSEYFHVVIHGEYERTLLNEIEKIYLKAGWGDAKCKGSSENGERPGLTGLQLWKTKPAEEITKS